MKTLLILFILLFPCASFAEESKILYDIPNHQIKMRTICLDGYLFFHSVTYIPPGRAVSSTQSYQVMENILEPARCKENKDE